MTTKLAAVAAAMLFATAWGPTGTIDYGAAVSMPASQTAIIRTASKEEGRYKISTARKIFGGGTSFATMIAIASGYDVPDTLNVKKFAAVRVKPGRYLVLVTCTDAMFTKRVDLWINAAQGGEYLLECHGAGFQARAHAWRKDMPDETEEQTAGVAPTKPAQPVTPPAPSTWVAPWRR